MVERLWGEGQTHLLENLRHFEPQPSRVQADTEGSSSDLLGFGTLQVLRLEHLGSVDLLLVHAEQRCGRSHTSQRHHVSGAEVKHFPAGPLSLKFNVQYLDRKSVV